MRLRSILVYSIATAALAIVSPSVTPILDIPSIAQARTSISINAFYDDLAPFGSWTSYQDTYVFVPADLPAHWRPYTVGHWVHTKRYGWLWVSNEPFGWATYHYGRWGYAEDIGWYWVPGTRWAPAWVSWRRSSDHVVWAPLPPGGDDVSIEVKIEDIPDDYWVAVPSRDFLDDDLSVVVVSDDTERVRFVEAAEPLGNVTIVNNVVVNNVIDVGYVEKTTEKKVETVQVKQTDDPKQVGKGTRGEVAVFSGEVKEEKGAKPSQVKDVEEVKKQRTQTGETPQGQQPTTEGQGTTQEQGTTTTEGQEQPTKKKKATGTEEPGQQQEAQPEEGQQPMKKKQQKAKGTEEPGQQQEAPPEEGQQPTKKKQQKAKGTEEPARQQEAQPEEGQGEMIRKKQKSKAYGQPAQPQEAQPEQGQEPMKKKKSKSSEEPTQGEQPKAGCDPSTGQGC